MKTLRDLKAMIVLLDDATAIDNMVGGCTNLPLASDGSVDWRFAEVENDHNHFLNCIIL